MTVFFLSLFFNFFVYACFVVFSKLFFGTADKHNNTLTHTQGVFSPSLFLLAKNIDSVLRSRTIRDEMGGEGKEHCVPRRNAKAKENNVLCSEAGWSGKRIVTERATPNTTQLLHHHYHHHQPTKYTNDLGFFRHRALSFFHRFRCLLFISLLFPLLFCRSKYAYQGDGGPREKVHAAKPIPPSLFPAAPCATAEQFVTLAHNSNTIVVYMGEGAREGKGHRTQMLPLFVENSHPTTPKPYAAVCVCLCASVCLKASCFRRGWESVPK